jgi:hypothetical protein
VRARQFQLGKIPARIALGNFGGDGGTVPKFDVRGRSPDYMSIGHHSSIRRPQHARAAALRASGVGKDANG